MSVLKDSAMNINYTMCIHREPAIICLQDRSPCLLVSSFLRFSILSIPDI
jgi:hypothetical protein